MATAFEFGISQAFKNFVKNLFLLNALQLLTFVLSRDFTSSV